MGWWVHSWYEAGGAFLVASWAFWVIFSITLHELGHGWAALWQGDSTPRDLGRMTMNPLVHMGTTSLLIFALIGIAWGAMPVNPSRFRHRRFGHLFVAAAGPLVNLGLAILCIIGLNVVYLTVSPEAAMFEKLDTFFFFGAMLNLVLMVFNLLPVPPLDGSTVLASLSSGYRRLLQHEQAPMFGLAFLAIVFFTGIGEGLFIAASMIVGFSLIAG
jgi:Zn-dependent protease